MVILNDEHNSHEPVQVIGILPIAIETHRFLKLPEVRLAVGLSTASIYKYMAKGQFPNGVLLSERCRRWPASDIYDWLRSRAPSSATSSAQPAAGMEGGA